MDKNAGKPMERKESMGGTGAAPGDDWGRGTQNQSDPRDDELNGSSRGSAPRSGWTVYVDSTYGFSIHHPEAFKIRSQDVARLTQFTPKPVASIFFMNPAMAAGDLAGIEPPDLEVRIYPAGTSHSLKEWLVSVGFASDGGASTEPYVSRGFSGLKVCQSTMIAPGCSIYTLHRGFVYQLTPISLEGETMIETFSLPFTPVPREP